MKLRLKERSLCLAHGVLKT